MEVISLRGRVEAITSAQQPDGRWESGVLDAEVMQVKVKDLGVLAFPLTKQSDGPDFVARFMAAVDL